GGSAWEYDAQTQMYYLHLFSKKQPDLNWENEKVRQEVYDMMKFWCEKGIDGFRMDVISMISKDPAYPDGIVHNGLYGDNSPYVCNGPRVHEYLQEMNQKVLSKFDLITVGEAAGVTVEEAKKYANLDGSELNMVFQFEHVDAPTAEHGKWTDKRFELKRLRSILNKWQTQLEGKAWNSLYWDNHDQPRAVSRFGNDGPMYRELSAKMLATCLHMLKGTPYIYQGEEIGMTNAYFDKMEDYRDIESINTYKEFTENGLMNPEEMMSALKAVSRDNARTPMQWNTSAHAGFTTGEPWIRVNPNYLQINAEAAVEDKNSIYYYYQKLIKLRKNYEIIIDGIFEGLLEEDENIYAYARNLGSQRLVVACNFSGEEVSCDLFDRAEEGKELISNYEYHK
uniref:alpha-amylase family glycosyl hydrolase n=1 Tax=Blautia sp. TaxID=1955243 RepID=UPI003FEDC72C